MPKHAKSRIAQLDYQFHHRTAALWKQRGERGEKAAVKRLTKAKRRK